MDQVRGQQPGSSIHHAHNGFFYLRYQSTNGRHYLRCTAWRQGCPGRGILTSDHVFEITNWHCHGPDFSRAEDLRQRNVMLDQARSQPLSLHDLFSLNGLQPAARSSLYRAVSRSRSQTLPRLENLAGLIAILENPLYAWLATSDQLGDANGYRGSVQAPNGSQILLFLNKKCENFLKIVTSLTIIQTSTVINEQQHLVITVASMWDGNMISLASLLFESGDAETMLAGFSLLRTFLPTHQIRQIVNYKDEVVAAFHAVFPTVKIQPSLFDYIHELKTNMELSDCVPNLLQSPGGVLIVKMCCAISLLPKDLMQIGVNHIINRAHSAGGEISTLCQQLFNWIDREWLHATCFEFNLCGDFERTHYGIENLKLKLEQNLPKCNTFYSITRCIIDSHSRAQQKISTVVCGFGLRSSVPKPITAEHQFWNLLDATGFPLEMKTNNILTFVLGKLLV